MSQQLPTAATAASPLPVTHAAPLPAAFTNFAQLPDDAFVREPIVRALYSVSHATVWRWVKAGVIPQPVRLSPRTSAWKVGELRAALRGAS